MADDKLVYTYVPDLIRYYLGEEPILPNVDTWRLEEPDALEEVLDRLDELVVKPVDGSGGKGLVVGPQASAAELATLEVRLRAGPARLDRAAGRSAVDRPDARRATGLRPRHIDLRPFAVNDGESVWVLPGGLTRVALPEGALVVNSSQGGGSKDTWVLGGAVPRRACATRVRPARRPVRARRRGAHDSTRTTCAPRSMQQQQQRQRRSRQEVRAC